MLTKIRWKWNGFVDNVLIKFYKSQQYIYDILFKNEKSIEQGDKYQNGDAIYTINCTQTTTETKITDIKDKTVASGYLGPVETDTIEEWIRKKIDSGERFKFIFSGCYTNPNEKNQKTLRKLIRLRDKYSNQVILINQNQSNNKEYFNILQKKSTDTIEKGLGLEENNQIAMNIKSCINREPEKAKISFNKFIAGDNNILINSNENDTIVKAFESRAESKKILAKTGWPIFVTGLVISITLSFISAGIVPAAAIAIGVIGSIASAISSIGRGDVFKSFGMRKAIKAIDSIKKATGISDETSEDIYIMHYKKTNTPTYLNIGEIKTISEWLEEKNKLCEKFKLIFSGCYINPDEKNTVQKELDKLKSKYKDQVLIDASAEETGIKKILINNNLCLDNKLPTDIEGKMTDGTAGVVFKKFNIDINKNKYVEGSTGINMFKKRMDTKKKQAIIGWSLLAIGAVAFIGFSILSSGALPLILSIAVGFVASISAGLMIVGGSNAIKSLGMKKAVEAFKKISGAITAKPEELQKEKESDKLNQAIQKQKLLITKKNTSSKEQKVILKQENNTHLIKIIKKIASKKNRIVGCAWAMSKKNTQNITNKGVEEIKNDAINETIQAIKQKQ